MQFEDTLRLQAQGRILEKFVPKLYAWFWNRLVLSLSTEVFGILPKEWRLNVPPTTGTMIDPIINDKIVDVLRNK